MRTAAAALSGEGWIVSVARDRKLSNSSGDVARSPLLIVAMTTTGNPSSLAPR
jgi:hypothetical protein